jgi:hypothetical protein
LQVSVTISNCSMHCYVSFKTDVFQTLRKSGQICHCSSVDRANKYYGRYTTSAPPPRMAQKPPVGQGRLTVQAARSHSDTPHSVGLLWTSDQPVTKTSTWQNATLTETDIHAPGGIRTRNPSKWKTAVPPDQPAWPLGSALHNVFGEHNYFCAWRESNYKFSFFQAVTWSLCSLRCVSE